MSSRRYNTSENNEQRQFRKYATAVAARSGIRYAGVGKQNIERQRDQKEGWEREVLEKLAFAALNEQRARRRWGIFFKLAMLGIIAFGLWLAFDLGNTDMETFGAHTALIEIDGTIEDGGAGAAEAVIPALNRAYADSGSVGVDFAYQ